MTGQIREILRRDLRIAVLGYTDKPERAGHYVPAYLAGHGYALFGVNPNLAGRAVPPARGRVVEKLADLTEPVDLVLIFRRSEEIPGHVTEILSLRPLPRTVWMQQGIAHPEAARLLERQGLRVIQDRCMLRDHQLLR
ncbi:MAG: CoA-binding protein [Candidatus Eremiobacterota bacterium]